MDKNQRLMNFRPLLTVAIFFILGIVTPVLYLITNLAVYLISVAVVLGLIVFLAFKRGKEFNKIAYATYGIALAFTLFGSLVTFGRIAYNLNADKLGNLNFSGYVQKISSKEELQVGYEYGIVFNADINGKTEKVYVVLKTQEEIKVYTKLTLKGKINNYYCKEENKVNLYPLTENIRYSVFDPALIQINGVKSGVVPTLRNYLYDTLKTYCNENYGVINAILTGDTSGISNYDLNTYRNLGIAHIFAVSGLHIGFLYTAVSLLLKLFKLKKSTSAFIIIPILFSYVAFCGFTSSCMRAFIMVALKVIADGLGFKRDSVNSVSLGAIFVLTINPTSIFTIGFQLSFLAYAGIILFTNPCKNLLSKFLPLKFSEFISPYIVAYLSTLPIMVDCFGYLAPFSIIFNIFVIPVIGVIYVCSFIVAIFLMISPFFKGLGLIPEYVFKLVNLVIRNLHSEFFLIRNLKFLLSTPFYYFSFIVTLDKFNITKRERIILFSILITCFLASFIIINLA